ncbi:MAG: glycosyltransferase, partial [Dehalococcoidia bacterium]|nr:glycosyltransferase [Dehalococcoidia bacterium]
IAYFSPLPPSPTGVADYSQDLLPHLAGLAQVDLFVDASSIDGARPGLGLSVHSCQEFERLAHHYQACLYHLGNDPSHEFVLDTMLRFPSFAVLHDVSVHALIVALTVGRGDLVAYMREMGYAYGRQGIAEARAAYVGRFFRYEEFPLCQRVMDLSLGTVVHSQYAAGIVRSLRPHANLAVIPHGVSPIEVGAGEECRRRLGLDAGEYIIAALGLATPNKRLEPALRAFARLLESRPSCRFMVVGEVPPWYDLAGIVESLGLGDRVVLTGRVSLEDFHAYAAAADVCLALRHPTNGETSGALLRAMSVGRPVVVSREGSFAELPADACVHVAVDDGEEDEILEALDRLAADDALRQTLGRSAQAFVGREHSWQQAAARYHQFIKNTLGDLSDEGVA